MRNPFAEDKRGISYCYAEVFVSRLAGAPMLRLRTNAHGVHFVLHAVVWRHYGIHVAVGVDVRGYERGILYAPK